MRLKQISRFQIYVEPDSKEIFRVKVFYPVLDTMIKEMDLNVFSNTNSNIMKCNFFEGGRDCPFG